VEGRRWWRLRKTTSRLDLHHPALPVSAAATLSYSIAPGPGDVEGIDRISSLPNYLRCRVIARLLLARTVALSTCRRGLWRA